MPHRPTRRRFLKTSTFAGLSVWIASRDSHAAEPASPNDKLNVGIIGTTGRGGENLHGVSSENIVALCDVDDNLLGPVAAKYPKAARFNDFRKMLEEAKNLDAVVVSTADHCHASATVMALRLGKHVYCEKPLTHTVAEARLVATEAAKAKKATQMGTQIHAGENYRRVVELIQAGAIGTVSRVHTFVRADYNPKPLYKGAEIPAGFHWDLWLGPAPERPYQPIYHPAQWRRFWDFGNGTLGDFGCHHMDLPFWALGLRAPTTVEATGPAPDPDRTALDLQIDYHFPARRNQPPVHLTWYNGDKHPPIFAESGYPLKWGNGNLFIGDKGMLAADYGMLKLLPEDRYKDFQAPPHSIPKSIGHHAEWIKACKEGTPTTCNFDYGGALTETVLLGNAAYRAGKKLEWDTAKLTVSNTRDADPFIQPPRRKGWEL
jgi:predicted dehydrogenase